ncbi:uncharacterized protein LOC143510264 isoform X2 [Brachyhypopomus gauderio]|uniref:uncharacterized protein LOC143510264 isoform X2 n=1 Tax=Brachyhypopomus gauderio TaxID=698409 RepID=UPI0040428CE4
MSTDYVTPLLQNKRRGEEDYVRWECQSKRMCPGLGRSVQVEYGAVTARQVDTREPPLVRPPNHSSTAHHITTPGGSVQLQRCSRCLAGEPGHINHIMQRY